MGGETMDFGLFSTWNAVYAGDKVPWDPDYNGGTLLEEDACATGLSHSRCEALEGHSREAPPSSVANSSRARFRSWSIQHKRRTKRETRAAP